MIIEIADMTMAMIETHHFYRWNVKNPGTKKEMQQIPMVKPNWAE